MNISEQMLKKTPIFKGRVFEVSVDDVKLCDGSETTREVVWHGGGTACVAIDENNDIHLVKQWRYPFGKELLEIPAGKLEPNEEPIECAKRELVEEIGLFPKDIELLAEMYAAPAYLNEKLSIYIAREFEQKVQNLDDGEFLDVVKIPFKKAFDMVLSGEIKDAKTQIGILKAKIVLDCEEVKNM